ncbi:MAG: CDP-diacylglycerol--serine O-phosphatidyltransferase [Bdellovibrionales bacterium]|nr:CDP-diacylglycerol--serine O-phosphatidyltransferase [Bdellovibrionales bacterium]
MEQPTEVGAPFRRRTELLIFILPNLFTTANLFFGFYSIVCSIRGMWTNSALAILLAAFSDGLDGRVARLTKTQSAFGEQYDSNSDLVSFGVAPALLMYQWALAPYGRLAWFASFMYLTCAALRLARFNVLKQSTEKRYFQGCPSPIAACAVATAVLFYQELGFEAWKSLYMLIVMFILAAAMVSMVRYRSFKDLNFSSQRGFGYLVILIAAIVLFSTFPEKLLFPVFITYVIIGPVFEFMRWTRRRVKGRLRLPRRGGGAPA